MLRIISLALLFGSSIMACSQKKAGEAQMALNNIASVEMNLNAFGVESDSFPTIAAKLDFVHNTSVCTKSYYDPAVKGSVYHLSKNEMRRVLTLLQRMDFRRLKSAYRVARTDQPTSTIAIYANGGKLISEDYGLNGDNPLPELYGLIYKY